MTKAIYVIANPASGQPEPVLQTLNTIFREAGWDWDIAITKQSGDATRLAERATRAGVDVVAAYGGDGTVMEVAMGLRGVDTPLAILPGGTANLMAVELGIPKNLEQAARIACGQTSQVRQVDMGRIGEDNFFLLRVGIGFGARKVQYADRAMKDKYGILAYTLAGLKALKDQNKAHFRLVLDGEQIEVDGLACLIDNAGNMGMPGVAPARDISVSDGLLDIIIVRSQAFISLLTAGPKLYEDDALDELIYHRQAKHIHIESSPAQPVQVDGELAGTTPVDIQVVPQAVSVLVQGQEG
jgi:diacylglycerol kinase (ATP)